MKRMAYIVVNVWFPPQKSNEIGKKALEVIQKVRKEPIGTNIIPGALMRTRNGIKGMTIFEIKEGELETAIERANEMIEIYSEVEGVNAEIDIMATMAEALSSIGLKAPD